MGSSYSLSKRRLLPTRVAPTWSFLTLTDSVFSFGVCRQALPQLLAAPLRARLLGLSHSLPRPGEGRSPLTPGWHGVPAPPARPPRGAIFPRQSSLFYNSFPITRYSRFLGDSLASSTGLRLPASALFYVPKQNTRDTSGLIFRTLSAPLPLDSSQHLRFHFLVNLSLGTPR